MRAPAFWWRAPGLASTLLGPFGAIYGAIADRRLEQPGEAAGVPVVCIGNPTLGGAGKTPTALAVAALLAEAGERPVFLARGYGGSLPGPVEVDPALHDFRAVGDEPLLLARHFPTVIARDRLAGARFARDLGATVVVMDDGFQNSRLAKDFSLLVIDARRGLGNGRIFPAGPLRAGLVRQLRKADAVLVIGQGTRAEGVEELAISHGLPLFSARLEPDRAAVASLRGTRALAFAGIGDPEKFFATLDAANIAAPMRRGFPDHHAYTAAEAAELMRVAEAQGLVPVTTEKDFMRLSAHPALHARAQALPVSLVLDDPKGLAAAVLSAVRKTP